MRDVGYGPGQPIWNQRVFYELLLRLSDGKYWLDVGCGRGTRSEELKRVRTLFRESLYVGLDADMASLKDNKTPLKACADVTALPFSSESFDLVTSNMVFEHLKEPLAALQEMARVLTDGGTLLIHTASSLHGELLVARVLSKLLPRDTYVSLASRYTGRRPEDIFPTEYRANTAARLARMARQAGLHPVLSSYVETPYFFPKPLNWAERWIRPVAPGFFKGTLLAFCIKLADDKKAVAQ